MKKNVIDELDKYVPIIKNTKHSYVVYLTNPIEAPSVYTGLYHLLFNADEDTKIELVINNGGGWLDTSFQIIDQISTSKATVTAKLYGTVASAATIIALACNEIYVSNHISWLSHNYSGGVEGKGNELKSQMEFMSKELIATFTTIHNGFFTENEIKNLIKDKDMWLNKSEIEARWKARKNNDTKLLNKIAKKREAQDNE